MPIGLVGGFSINDTNFRGRGNCFRRSARRVMKLRARKARSQKTALSRGFFRGGMTWCAAASTLSFVPLGVYPSRTPVRLRTTKRNARSLVMVPFPRHDFEVLPES